MTYPSNGRMMSPGNASGAFLKAILERANPGAKVFECEIFWDAKV
jgi:hypothetical protein